METLNLDDLSFESLLLALLELELELDFGWGALVFPSVARIRIEGRCSCCDVSLLFSTFSLFVLFSCDCVVCVVCVGAGWGWRSGFWVR